MFLKCFWCWDNGTARVADSKSQLLSLHFSTKLRNTWKARNYASVVCVLWRHRRHGKTRVRNFCNVKDLRKTVVVTRLKGPRRKPLASEKHRDWIAMYLTRQNAFVDHEDLTNLSIQMENCLYASIAIVLQWSKISGLPEKPVSAFIKEKAAEKLSLFKTVCFVKTF